MKTNGKHEVMTQIARQSLVLAALLAIVLSTASISRAQSSAASHTAPAAKPAAAPAKAPALPAAKGQHEGIKVHGHWTIEVRNPDGSLAKRVEFENSLVTPTNYPGASMTGSQGLVALLSGAGVVSPSTATTIGLGSPWLIDLESVNSGDVSPCPGHGDLVQLRKILGLPGSSSVDSCTSAASITPPSTATLFTLSSSSSTSSLPNQLVLSGTVPSAAVTQSGTIDTVTTLMLLVPPSQNDGGVPPLFPITLASLPAQGSGTCGGANQPPCAVSVGAGQSITATVIISFQ